MAETRARRRIRQAVEAKGYRLRSLTWEPWGSAAEKSGPSGGWFGEVEPPWGINLDTGRQWVFPGDDLCGLSVKDVLDAIVRWPDRTRKKASTS